MILLCGKRGTLVKLAAVCGGTIRLAVQPPGLLSDVVLC